MADNTVINTATTPGQSIATKDIGGINHELVLLEFGDGAGGATEVEASTPLPVTDAVAEAALASIAAEDFATQTTLAALLAKVIAAPSTEAKQDAMITLLTTIAAITQPLTDAQLRATAVPVSGTIATGGLTDVQLRATPVPISGTISTGLTQPLTDTQLRATPVPVSGTVTVTGAGDATAANQATQITAEQAIQAAVQIMDDWDESDRAKVNLIVGQAGIAAGTGVDGVTVPRVTLATNVALPAGTNLLGKTGIDQTTPGTTNLVALSAETTKVIGTVNNAAGSNLIGKVGIDQTTPGTTNAVVEASAVAILAKLTAAAASFVKLEDVASVDADAGVPMLAVRQSTPANTSGTNGDYEFLQMNAGKLWVQAGATQKPSIGATVVLAVTALNSLANSATVGWKSVMVNNITNLATDYLVNVKFTMANTAPANDKAAYLMVIPWYYDGSVWYAASGGTATLPTDADAGYTIASPNNFLLLGVLNYTTQQMILQGTFLLSNCFGNRLPQGFSFFVENFTGAALSASGNIVQYSPINDILV